MNRTCLAQEIIETCLEMSRLGLNQGTSGNISARYQDGMLITPSGVPYHKMTPDEIVFISYEGKAEANKVPSSEWLFHLACYQARPELNAVVHNHAVNSTVVSILNHAIPAIHYMIAVTGGDNVPCIPYAIFGSRELAERVEQGIKTSKALLMQHHGMIAMEVNLEKALWLANEVEVLAKMYLNIRAISDTVPVLSDQEMRHVHHKFKTYGLKTDK